MTHKTLTMSKIVINNCVMKGYHAYEPVVNAGDTFECQPEINNVYDSNAVAVHSASGEVIGMFLSIYAITWGPFSLAYQANWLYYGK